MLVIMEAPTVHNIGILHPGTKARKEGTGGIRSCRIPMFVWFGCLVRNEELLGDVMTQTFQGRLVRGWCSKKHKASDRF